MNTLNTLKNGATIIAQRDEMVLAYTSHGAAQPWVIWSIRDSETFNGYYFHDELSAFDAWIDIFTQGLGATVER